MSVSEDLDYQETIALLQDELGRYEQTKSSLHFAVDEPLPGHLVRRLILVRMRECGLL